MLSSSFEWMAQAEIMQKTVFRWAVCIGEPNERTVAAVKAIADVDLLERLTEEILQATTWQELLDTPLDEFPVRACTARVPFVAETSTPKVRELAAAAAELKPSELRQLLGEIDRLEKASRAIMLKPPGLTCRLVPLNDPSTWRCNAAALPSRTITDTTCITVLGRAGGWISLSFTLPCEN